MRIVAVADTHTYQAHLGPVADGDVFVHAGDLLQDGTLDELGRVAEWIHRLPHRHKVVIAGNHDWCFLRDVEASRELLGDVVYLQDSGAPVGGLRFWGSPWQPEFGGWAFNLPRGPALAEKWAAIPDGLDVLITHGPPRGIGDLTRTDHRAGCEDLRARVAQARPRVHLFGHIHQDGGAFREATTCFFNVTTWECERAPTVFDLDPSTGVVTEVVTPRATTRARW
jgi:predicted phosphodiesterase